MRFYVIALNESVPIVGHMNLKHPTVRRYIHNQDWDNAERVAEQHDKSAMSDVLLSRAKVEFEAANYPRFEALMLRCHKPELIVKQYQVELDATIFTVRNVSRSSISCSLKMYSKHCLNIYNFEQIAFDLTSRPLAEQIRSLFRANG